MKHVGNCTKYFHSGIVAILIVCVGILNIQIHAASAVETQIAEGASAGDTADAKPVEPSKDEPAQSTASQYATPVVAGQAKTTTSDSGGKKWLYAGAGVAAAAAVAVAAGAGGSSSSSPAEPEVPKEDPVGADLNGNNWHGRLILADSGYKEEVTATVYQNGSTLEITTSTTQKYGSKFVGKINKSAFIKARDQTTGQDWTTFYSKARWNMIDLYDYVHTFHDMDRLYLTREALQ